MLAVKDIINPSEGKAKKFTHHSINKYFSFFNSWTANKVLKRILRR